jgi:hypothetical protein
MREQDYLSNDPAVNPMMFNWTRVYLPYGDGTSQLGDVAAPVAVAPGAPPIYFRGARVLRAVIAALSAAGLSRAKEVVVSGCSAGGLSTYAHADTWAAALPRARVVAMADSGFFLNYNATNVPANATYPARMLWTFANANVSGGGLLSPACLAAHAGSEWLCMFAENLAPHLRTPLFALQSVFDSYQVGAIAHADPADDAAVNAYGALLRARVHEALLGASPKHGAALDACYHHCGRFWNNISFAGIDIDHSQGEAFAAWYGGAAACEGSPQVCEQQEAYPCKDCCTSAQR